MTNAYGPIMPPYLAPAETDPYASRPMSTNFSTDQLRDRTTILRVAADGRVELLLSLPFDVDPATYAAGKADATEPDVATDAEPETATTPPWREEGYVDQNARDALLTAARVLDKPDDITLSQLIVDLVNAWLCNCDANSDMRSELLRRQDQLQQQRELLVRAVKAIRQVPNRGALLSEVRDELRAIGTAAVKMGARP